MTTQTNYDYIKTPKNDEGKYECERCQTEFNDESEVCWAECGDYSKKHGVPLCAECCEDQQENWGECCDSDHDDDHNHEDNDDDEEEITITTHTITEIFKGTFPELLKAAYPTNPFTWTYLTKEEVRQKVPHLCPPRTEEESEEEDSEEEEQDELNAAIDASGNALY